jgi:hypothetical protein
VREFNVEVMGVSVPIGRAETGKIIDKQTRRTHTKKTKEKKG